MDDATILLVEDEAPIRDGVESLLVGQGLRVRAVDDGARADEALRAGGYDLVVLDWMLPGVSGIEVLRRARGRGDPTPVLMLTARGAEDDVVAALEAGADDYVTKPFGVRELVARIRGLLRRPRPSPEPTHLTRRRLKGGVSLDHDLLEIRWAGGVLRLTRRESDLLAHLATHHERVVPRDELLVQVWGYRDGSVRTRTVDVHVQQLRAKLRAVPGGEAWVGTVRGRGYRFEGEPE